jgi:ParB family chromosome partitioning protein
MTASYKTLLVARESVASSPLNPRTIYNNEKIQQMAVSMQSNGVGIISPLIVRPFNGSGRWEVIAGECRLRAATLAGLEQVPVIVRALADAAVLEIMMTENVQRNDLHPFNEADGYNRMLKTGHTVETISDRIGVPKGRIYKRLQLLQLIPELRDLFLQGELPEGHALLLARLQPAAQDLALATEGALFHRSATWDDAKRKTVQGPREVQSLAHLRSWIETNVYLDLMTAAFSTRDAGLLPPAGACINCQKRTGANALLFDDVRKGDHCLDRACFQAKLGAHIVRAEQKALDNGTPLIRISRAYVNPNEAKDLKALNTGEYTLVTGKKDKCASATGAIVVHGQQIGQTVRVCNDPGCPQHGRKHGMPRVPTSLAKVTARKEEIAAERIERETRRAIFVAVLEKVPAKPTSEFLQTTAAALLDAMSHEHARQLCGLLGLTPEKVHDYVSFGTTLATHLKKQATDAALIRFIFACAVNPDLIPHLHSERPNRLDQWARSLKVDTGAIRKRVAGPIEKKLRAWKGQNPVPGQSKTVDNPKKAASSITKVRGAKQDAQPKVRR